MADQNAVVKDEVTGMTMKEAKPDSADDLLLTDEARAARAAAANPGAPPAPAAPAAPEPTGEPAVQPAPAAPAPAPATPEVAPAATPAPAPVAAPEAAPSVDEGKGLKELAELLETQRTEILSDAQSVNDRAITRIAERHKAQEIALKERVRALEMTGLTDEEKEALTKKHDLEDREAKLTAYNDELDAQHDDIAIARLSLEYKPYNVTEVSLRGKTVEEMTVYCLQKKSDYFENLARGGGTTAALAPATPAPAAETPPEKPAPAGATAPSDVGGPAPAQPEQEFDKSMGRDAMLKNLQKLPAETVDTGQRA